MESSTTSTISEQLSQFSVLTRAMLQLYPTWQAAVAEALSLDQVTTDREPSIVEIFDQQGLLAGRINGYVYTTWVPYDHQSIFQAWYFDGELVVFYAGDEVIVNRLETLGATQ